MMAQRRGIRTRPRGQSEKSPKEVTGGMKEAHRDSWEMAMENGPDQIAKGITHQTVKFQLHLKHLGKEAKEDFRPESHLIRFVIQAEIKDSGTPGGLRVGSHL